MALTIQIGEMRSTAKLQTNAPVSNGSGGQKDVWSDVYTFRCRIRQNKSGRNIEQMQPVNNQTYEVICRFASIIRDSIGYDARIIYNNEVYTINSFDLVELNKKHWYKITMSKNG